MVGRRILIAAGISGLLSAAGFAAAPGAGKDWSQWRGPDRTGVSAETGLLKAWPAGGPKLLWKAPGRGRGYSTPSVAAGRVYGMGAVDGRETVWAVEESTGKPLWITPISAAVRQDRRGEGSRGTPTVDGELLYAVADSGDLACLETATGKVRWQKSFVGDFGGSVPRWGSSESPLVDGNRVVATPGGRNATLVALDKRTGEVIWKAVTPQGDSAGYSSAIAADIDGQRTYIQFVSGCVVGIAAKDGKFLWRYDSPANGTANCSTPIYRNNHVFAASAYSTGGGLAKLTTTPAGVTVNEVYFTKSMQNHHGGMVLVGDYLYGFDNSNLTCLDFKTGEVKWSDRSVGKGSVTAADGHIYARSERGPVALVEATPQGYVEKSRFDQTDRSEMPSWAHPVISGGRLYLRDQDHLLCYDLKP